MKSDTIAHASVKWQMYTRTLYMYLTQETEEFMS